MEIPFRDLLYDLAFGGTSLGVREITAKQPYHMVRLRVPQGYPQDRAYYSDYHANLVAPVGKAPVGEARAPRGNPFRFVAAKIFRAVLFHIELK
jgi:hypothetical protein